MPQLPASWQEYAPWLRGLRWLDLLEVGLAWAVLGASLLAAILWSWRPGPGYALLLLGAHLILLAAVLLNARRPQAPAWLALILVSALNSSFALVAGHFPLSLLAWCYLGLSVPALGCAVRGWWRLRQRLSGLVRLEQRDDFRWLVTQSPCAARWWVKRLLANAPAD